MGQAEEALNHSGISPGEAQPVRKMRDRVGDPGLLPGVESWVGRPGRPGRPPGPQFFPQ